MLRLLCGGVVVLAGCLGPLVSDDIEQPGLILAPGTTVPSVYDDPEEAAEIEENDGVDGLVPLLSGFAGGAPVAYWDFGPAPEFAAPIYVFVTRNGDVLEPAAHPSVIGSVPGDAGYTPFWSKFVVELTPAYGGEIFPSVAAIQEGVRRGLLLAPAFAAAVVNRPVVAPDVRLEAPGGEPIAPGGRFYYDGTTGVCFDFGESSLLPDGVHVPAVNLYVLRREGGEPLSEPARGVDMDGDGDVKDTNNVFSAVRGTEDYSPLCRLVSVTVPVTTASIDTAQNQAIADVRAESDLFTRTETGIAPVPGRVIAYQVEERLIHCAQAGGP